jgi:hypothetical protein
MENAADEAEPQATVIRAVMGICVLGNRADLLDSP